MGTTTVDFSKDCRALKIIDQTLLPNEYKTIEIFEPKDVFDAIITLKVRGAPAIGVAVAIAIAVFANQNVACDSQELVKKLQDYCKYLATSRPTAVNLFWAIDKMQQQISDCQGFTSQKIADILTQTAKQIREDDIQVCKKIGENGLALLKPNMGILTHCNAGALATVKYGTATAPIYLGHEQGYNFKVYADETRPLLQGARLTAYELKNAGIDVTVICDNMAAYAMQQGLINAVIIGCDRVAKNGDTANKIGSLGVAVLAKHFNIPFYVATPTSTIDINCKDGKAINIEQREGSEITNKWYKNPMAAPNTKTLNPAFDVTPNSLITAIITQNAVLTPPYNFA